MLAGKEDVVTWLLEKLIGKAAVQRGLWQACSS
jgi:hypothetical protein